jgi:hypothetical protein
VTLNDLLEDVLGRLEELPGNNNGAPLPIFWNQTYEILPELVDSMFEAALLTGVVQAVNIPVTLQPLTTYFSLALGQGYGFGGFGEGGYGGGSGIPAGAIATLRLKAPWPIRKVSLEALDGTEPNWQNALPGNKLRAWFPLGVSGFGIWPQMTDETVVLMDFLVSPVVAPRPYTTDIVVPFQEEFTSAFPEYAAAMLRMKELGAETEETETINAAYLEKMRRLSLYQNRLDSLVFTQSFGANAGVNRRMVV